MESVVRPPISQKTVLRIAVGAMFFMAGLCFSSWASRIPTVQAKLGLTEAQLGAVLFAVPVGLMLSLPFAGWLITKIGSKRVLIVAILAYSIILIGLGLAQNVMEMVICLVAFGFAGNTVNISVNTQAVTAEGMHDKPIMASFHGLWSLAGFVGAWIGALMIGSGVDPFHHFVIIFIVAILSVIIVSRYLHNDYGASKNAVAATLTLRQRFSLIVPLFALGSIAFCSLICEGAMFDWSGIYFKKVVQAPHSLQGYGFTAFMFTMAGGRFLADLFSHRFGLKRTLQVSGSLTATGLLISVIFPQFYTAIAGFMLVGVGVSSVVPMVYSAAGKTKTMSPGVALAAVSTIGFLGFFVGPPLIGLIAGLATLRASFLFVAVMGIGVVTLSTIFKPDR